MPALPDARVPPASRSHLAAQLFGQLLDSLEVRDQALGKLTARRLPQFRPHCIEQILKLCGGSINPRLVELAPRKIRSRPDRESEKIRPHLGNWLLTHRVYAGRQHWQVLRWRCRGRA